MNTVINIPTLKRWVSERLGKQAAERLMTLWQEFKNSKKDAKVRLSSNDLDNANIRFGFYLDEVGEPTLSHLVGDWNHMLKSEIPINSQTNVRWIN